MSNWRYGYISRKHQLCNHRLLKLSSGIAEVAPQAYYRNARDCHPDKFPGDEMMRAKFQEAICDMIPGNLFVFSLGSDSWEYHETICGLDLNIMHQNALKDTGNRTFLVLLRTTRGGRCLCHPGRSCAKAEVRRGSSEKSGLLQYLESEYFSSCVSSMCLLLFSASNVFSCFSAWNFKN